MKKVLKIIGIILVVLALVGLISFAAFKLVKGKKEVVEVTVPNILKTTIVEEYPIEKTSYKLRKYLDNYDTAGYLIKEIEVAKDDEEVAKIKETLKPQFTDKEGKLNESAFNKAVEEQSINKSLLLIIKDRSHYGFNQYKIGDLPELKEEELKDLYNKKIDSMDPYYIKNEKGEVLKGEDGNPKIDYNKVGQINLSTSHNLVFYPYEDDKFFNDSLYKYSAFEIKGNDIIKLIKEDAVNFISRDINNKIVYLEELDLETDLDNELFEGEFRRVNLNDRNVKTATFQDGEDRQTLFLNDTLFNVLKDYKPRTKFRVLYNKNKEVVELREIGKPEKLNGKIVEVIGVNFDKNRLRIKEGGKELLLLFDDLVEEVKDLDLKVNDLIEVVYKNKEDEIVADDEQIEILVGDTTERKILVEIDRFNINKDSTIREDYKVLEKDELGKKDQEVLEKLLSIRGYYISNDNSNIVLISADKGKAIKIKDISIKAGKLNIDLIEEDSKIDKNYLILDVTNFGLEDLNNKENIVIKDQNNDSFKQMIIKVFD